MSESLIIQDLTNIVEPYCNEKGYNWVIYVISRISTGIVSKKVTFMVKVENKVIPPETEELFDNIQRLKENFNPDYKCEDIRSELYINTANRNFEERIILTFQI